MAMETGILIGIAVCCFLSNNIELYSMYEDGSCVGQPHFYVDFQLIYKIIGVGIIVALLFYFLLTRPYYKRRRVR